MNRGIVISIDKDNFFFGRMGIIIIAILSIVNSLCVKNPSLSLLLSIIESFILVLALVEYETNRFIIVFLVITSTSIENKLWALGDRDATFYSIFNIPVLHTYLIILIAFLGALKALSTYGMPRNIVAGGDGFSRFLRINIFFLLLSIPMAIFSFVINDNGIRTYAGMWRYIFRDGYLLIVTVSVVIMIVSGLVYNSEFENILEETILNILTGVTWAALLLIFFGNYYNYWGSEYYLTCPLILFFAPCLILFTFKESGGKLYLLTGVVSILIQLKYTVGMAGAWWIYVLAFGIVFIRKLISIGEIGVNTITKIVLLLVVVLIIFFVVSNDLLNIMSGQITYKLSRIMAYLRIRGAGGNVYSALRESGDSMSMRIEELVNVFLEFKEKPLYFVFGKGLGGSITRRWGDSNWSVSGSTFADDMISSGVYSSFHVAIVEIILNYGLMGMLFLFFIIKEMIVEVMKNNGNNWIIIGALWLIYYYSTMYSFMVCMSFIILGLYQKYRKSEEQLVFDK